MTNLGLHKAMSNAGINVIVSDVGDRYVIEEMKKANCNIGGEQSGHIIFMDYVTTGDGIITALHILTTMQRKNKTLAELALCMEEFPQLLTNMPVKEKKPIEECPKLLKVINESKKLLGENGRVIIRYSGTENKIRILVESIDSSLVDKVTANISTIIKEVLR
jgi:phosphoglucosamine mutase